VINGDGLDKAAVLYQPVDQYTLHPGVVFAALCCSTQDFNCHPSYYPSAKYRCRGFAVLQTLRLYSAASFGLVQTHALTVPPMSAAAREQPVVPNFAVLQAAAWRCTAFWSMQRLTMRLAAAMRTDGCYGGVHELTRPGWVACEPPSVCFTHCS
jgi:hypothetical protein